MDVAPLNLPDSKRNSRSSIGDKVRTLRQARRWNQAELAKRLHLSQARLSEIERGGGSFTAEQFIQILRLFNASVADFDPHGARDAHAELQNALVRLGATDLRESEHVLATEQFGDAARVVRDTLVAGTPRLLTALGPVIVQHVDRLNLRGLHLQLASVGLDRRLAWLAENVRDAVTEEAATAPPPLWLKRYRRALVVIDAYLGVVASPAASDVVPDILDADIRSKRSLDDVAAASSDVSKRWGVVTSLQPHDFVAALRSARASD